MKISFDYISEPNQIISRMVENDLFDEPQNEDMVDFFDTARMDDKVAGLFFRTQNVKDLKPEENTGQFLYIDKGVEVSTADITIKGEISFDGDYPEDDTIITITHLLPEKKIEKITFKEFKEDCQIDNNFPSEDEVETRINILTDDWSIFWDSEKIDGDANVKNEVESSKDEKEIFEDGPHKSFFQGEGLEGVLEKEGFLKNGQWDGLYKSYHDNGELKFEGHYKEGVRVGRWKNYSHTTPYIENQGFKGGLYDDFGYKDKYEVDELKTIADEGLEGLLDGPYTRYYFNRNIEFEGSYKNNKKNGIFKKYSFQGELESETNYNEGDVVD